MLLKSNKFSFTHVHSLCTLNIATSYNPVNCTPYYLATYQRHKHSYRLSEYINLNVYLSVRIALQYRIALASLDRYGVSMGTLPEYSFINWIIGPGIVPVFHGFTMHRTIPLYYSSKRVNVRFIIKIGDIYSEYMFSAYQRKDVVYLLRPCDSYLLL